MAKWSEQMNERWDRAMKDGGGSLLAKLIYTDHKKGAVKKVAVFEEDLEEREQELNAPGEPENAEEEIPANLKHPEKVKKVQKKCEEKREKKSQKAWGTVDRERIRKLHAKGKSGNEIARIMGKASSTIHYHIKIMGLEANGDNHKKPGGNGKKTSLAPIGPVELQQSMRQFCVVDGSDVKMTPVNPELTERVRKDRAKEEAGSKVIERTESYGVINEVQDDGTHRSFPARFHPELPLIERGNEEKWGDATVESVRRDIDNALSAVKPKDRELLTSLLYKKPAHEDPAFREQYSPFLRLTKAFSALTDSEKWDAFCFVLFSLTGGMLKAQGPAISADIQELWEKLEPPMESEVAA